MTINLPSLYAYSDADVSDSMATIPLDFLKESKLYRVVLEFTKAQYDLTSLELKTWLIVLSQLTEHADMDKGNIIYTFDPVKIADMLKIDKRKSRTGIMKDIFASLAQKTIRIEDRSSSKGDMFVASFFSAVYYEDKRKLMHVKMIPELHSLLFSFVKTIDTVSIDLKNILSLKRIASIRLFMAIRELDEQGINYISIADFRKIIFNDSYPKYGDFKKYVIKPVEKDIKEHTEYTDFSLTDNASRGVKATGVFFSMNDKSKIAEQKHQDKQEIIDSFKNISPSVRFKLKDYSYKSLDALALAVFAGFDEAFFSKIPLENEGLVVENILTALDYIHREHNEKHKHFSRDAVGRLIFAAIINNRAKVVTAAKKEDAQPSLVLKSETDDTVIKAMFTVAARKYLKNMDNRTYGSFVISNKDHMEYTFKQSLSLEDLIKRDGRKASYKILVKYVMLLGMKGQLDLGINLK